MSKQQPAKSDSRRAQLRAAQIEQAKRDKNKRMAIIAVAAVVIIALIIGIVLLVNRTRDTEVANVPPTVNADQTGIRVTPNAARDNAPVVSIFLDYQCPACARFEQTYGPVLDEMAQAGDIDLQYRTMTFMDTNLRNDTSTRAANAAACADLTGRYRQYHNAIFAYQLTTGGHEGIADGLLTGQLADQAGITGEAKNNFSTCYDTKRFSGFVDKVDEAAAQAGVTGTPTLQVNGKTMELTRLTDDPNSIRQEITNLA